jgi:hypothetical protein
MAPGLVPPSPEKKGGFHLTSRLVDQCHENLTQPYKIFSVRKEWLSPLFSRLVDQYHKIL